MLVVKFNYYSQMQIFADSDGETVPGDRVLAEGGQGLALGLVVSLEEAIPGEPEPPAIVRRATAEDVATASENERLAREAGLFCERCIRQRRLDMKLAHVETLFDRSKLIFYFTAPNRIDFRDLVKDLVREYHARIELRQIGVRHETQMLGAVGSCGMVCCCRRFLRNFMPVTIKMAKEQNLFLSPSKISGICGRLLCCLSYEQANYENFHRECPRLGKRYQTDRGRVKVVRASLFRNSVTLVTENNEAVELSLEEWRACAPQRPDSPEVQGEGEDAAGAAGRQAPGCNAPGHSMPGQTMSGRNAAGEKDATRRGFPPDDATLPFQTGAGQTGSSQTGLGRAGSGRTGSGPQASAQTGSGQTGSRQTGPSPQPIPGPKASGQKAGAEPRERHPAGRRPGGETPSATSSASAARPGGGRGASGKGEEASRRKRRK